MPLSLALPAVGPERPSSDTGVPFVTFAGASNAPPGVFICDICGFSLSRSSHLSRHRRLHLPTGQQSSFPCHQCGRSFSRKDVYLRHRRTTHEARDREPKSKRKSCLRCVQDKLKCNRNQPCASCFRKGRECSYAVTVEKSWPVAQLIPCVENGGGLPEKSDFYFHSSRNFVGSSTGIHRRPSQDARGNSPESPRASSASGLTDLDTDEIDTGQPTKDAIQEHPSHGQVYPHDLAPTDVSQDLETTSVDQVTGNGTADFTDPEDHSNGANFLPLFEIEAYTEFGLGELDWLNFELDSPNSLRIESEYVAREGNDYPENHDQAPYQPLLSSDETQEAHSVAPQLSTHPISAHNNNCSRPRTHHSGTRTGREQWPFDYSASSNPKKVQLPPLRQILESTVRPKRAIHRATHASLIELLSSPYLPPMDEVLEFHTMPAIVLLKQFLNLYLTEFNSVIPMIHVPTWELPTCPSVLLAAMACIGAGFSDAEGSVELQASLSEISLQTLSWLGGSDSTNHRDPAYVTACCLHQIYSLGSGNRHLYENADGSRGILVTSLRGMGMLRPRLRMENGDIAESSRHGYRSSTEWLKWRNEEMEKRITWSSFEYDCSLCTLTSRRGIVDLHELPSRLPCAEALWEAPSAQAWSALASCATSSLMGAFLPQMLRDIFAQKPIRPDVPAWGKRLCAQVIGRLLWDLKQLEMASMSSFLGLPSLTSAHKPTKAVLLKCLSNLCESISRPSCTADLIHLNITSLISHYSHLYTSEEAMDLVVHVFRGAVRDRRKQSRLELDFAKRRLAAVLTKNLKETRAMVWHAAQIIAMAREYFIHAPCETMRVFMGHIFILAYAKYGCPLSRGVEEQEHGRFPPVRLDQPTWREEQTPAIDRWIEKGGPASVGSVEDICDAACLGVLKEDALQMMRDMRIWGLGKKFCKVLDAFDT